MVGRLKKTSPVTHKGITMTLNRWALFSGLNRATLRTRILSWEEDRWFEGTELMLFNYFTVEQVDKKLKTNKICNICEFPMKNWRNNSQAVCIYTPAQKKRYKVRESPCQKVNRIKRMKEWRVGRKTGKIKVVVKHDTTKRRCLSTLSNPEIHWFDSKGRFNRICDACHETDLISTVYNRPTTKIIMSKKQTSN